MRVWFCIPRFERELLLTSRLRAQDLERSGVLPVIILCVLACSVGLELTYDVEGAVVGDSGSLDTFIITGFLCA